jgi:antagonist of KipI
MTGLRTLSVLSAGLLTTVQDRGRWGHQASGVPVAGPMDPVSHDAANAIVGNAPDAATLEITIVGPALRFDVAARLVVAGADLAAAVDGTPLPLSQARDVAPGAVLTFGHRRRGARAYVAIDGGVASPLVLGSRATHAVTGFGRPLASGDVLPLGPGHQRSGLRWTPITLPAGGARVRVRRGPQTEAATDAALAVLTRSRFVISPHSNRMGYRLTGPAIPLPPGPPMISDATFVGGIQVTPSGEAIVLMADRQTTGGYPQIATVITADVGVAGQLAPGDWLEFEAEA